ncbi:MAG: glycosyltransferase, partial [Sphingobacteriales bacterium]
AIGIIGRLVPVKNHYLFLKALKHVLDHSTKKVKAFIIGDGETRQDLENVARQSGIAFSTEKDAAHMHPLVNSLKLICLSSSKQNELLTESKHVLLYLFHEQTRYGTCRCAVVGGKLRRHGHGRHHVRRCHAFKYGRYRHHEQNHNRP